MATAYAPAPVLVWPGSPEGWCPLHTFEMAMCCPWCLPVRVEFAAAAADLERYWLFKYGRRSA